MNILIFGATGMVGQGVLREALLAHDVAQVTIIGRTTSGAAHPKLREIIHADLFDYRAIEAGLHGYDACFFCLGVSSGGMSEAAYAHLTYDLTLAAAQTLARHNPQMSFVYVSGAGTDSSERGGSMWARVKGRTENALLRLPFKAVYLFRPGVIEPLHGAVSKTAAYRIFYQAFGFILPLLRRIRPGAILSTVSMGQAMLAAARNGASKAVLESADIDALANRSAANAGAALRTPSAAPDGALGASPAASPIAPRSRARTWWRAIVVFLLLCAIAAIALGGCSAFGHLPDGAQLEALKRSPEWRDGRFNNPEPVWLNMRGALSRLFESNPGAVPAAESPIAVVRGDGAQFARQPDSGLRVTWFGHSSALLEIDGVTVLTDPMWSDVASPTGLIGPRRWYAPLIALDRLPKIDVVVISHDHYDHLDQGTILQLKNGAAVFVVPLGIGSHLRAWGVPGSRIVELDWWQATRIGGLTVTATPARHASGRVVPSTDKTLWSGFALQGPSHRVYYSGDTGFFPALREIGERLGPFDLAMIEAGQYDPDWPDFHLGPEQAVAAGVLVRAKVMMPVHWALFKLAHHDWQEPAERTLAAARCANLEVLIAQPGASVEPAVKPWPAPWWPARPLDAGKPRPVAATRHGDPAERFAVSPCDGARRAAGL